MITALILRSVNGTCDVIAHLFPPVPGIATFSQFLRVGCAVILPIIVIGLLTYGVYTCGFPSVSVAALRDALFRCLFRHLRCRFCTTRLSHAILWSITTLPFQLPCRILPWIHLHLRVYLYTRWVCAYVIFFPHGSSTRADAYTYNPAFVAVTRLTGSVAVGRLRLFRTFSTVSYSWLVGLIIQFIHSSAFFFLSTLPPTPTKTCVGLRLPFPPLPRFPPIPRRDTFPSPTWFVYDATLYPFHRIMIRLRWTRVCPFLPDPHSYLPPLPVTFVVRLWDVCFVNSHLCALTVRYWYRWLPLRRCHHWIYCSYTTPYPFCIVILRRFVCIYLLPTVPFHRWFVLYRSYGLHPCTHLPFGFNRRSPDAYHIHAHGYVRCVTLCCVAVVVVLPTCCLLAYGLFPVLGLRAGVCWFLRFAPFCVLAFPRWFITFYPTLPPPFPFPFCYRNVVPLPSTAVVITVARFAEHYRTFVPFSWRNPLVYPYSPTSHILVHSVWLRGSTTFPGRAISLACRHPYYLPGCSIHSTQHPHYRLHICVADVWLRWRFAFHHGLLPIPYNTPCTVAAFVARTFRGWFVAGTTPFPLYSHSFFGSVLVNWLFVVLRQCTFITVNVVTGGTHSSWHSVTNDYDARFVAALHVALPGAFYLLPGSTVTLPPITKVAPYPDYARMRVYTAGLPVVGTSRLLVPFAWLLDYARSRSSRCTFSHAARFTRTFALVVFQFSSTLYAPQPPPVCAVRRFTFGLRVPNQLLRCLRCVSFVRFQLFYLLPIITRPSVLRLRFALSRAAAYLVFPNYAGYYNNSTSTAPLFGGALHGSCYGVWHLLLPSSVRSTFQRWPVLPQLFC